MDRLATLAQLKRDHSAFLYRLEMNTFVLESQKILYMDTPKTGGTSLKTRLAELAAGYVAPSDGDSPEAVNEMFIHSRAINPLKSLTDFSEAEQADILFAEDWKRFCVIREPYSRLFSAWFSKVLLCEKGYRETLPGYTISDSFTTTSDVYAAFERFVLYLDSEGTTSDPHWGVQSDLLFGGDIKWNQVFRFEQLQEQLLQNSDFFGGWEVGLPKLNVSGYSPDWERVSPQCREAISRIYALDFEAYGYLASPPERSEADELLCTYINRVIARNKRISGLLDRLGQNKAESVELQCRLEQSKREIADLQGELNHALNSYSWKITRPLRALRQWLKHMKGN